MKTLYTGAAALALTLALASTPAQAAVIDFGVDITGSCSATQLGSVFVGDNTGCTVDDDSPLEFNINVPGLSLSTVTQALLFIDAESVGEGDSNWTFEIFGRDNSIIGGSFWATIGNLQSNAADDTTFTLDITPALGGIFGGDFLNEILIGGLFIRATASNNDAFRLDGANLNITTNQQITQTEPGAPVPEPASLILLGSGLVGVATRLRRRRAE